MEDSENKDDCDLPEFEKDVPPSDGKPAHQNKVYQRADELSEIARNISFTDAEKQLTEFQRKLVHNIVYKSMMKHVAARDAGSQAKSKEGLANLAWETLRKPHVQAYMAYLMEKKNALAGIDKIEVIEGLRDVITRCLVDNKYREAIKAYELLGSAIGLFKTVSQSTSIKKNNAEETSSLLDDSEGDEGAKKDLSKLITMISSSQPNKKK
mgnify:CR=1 FL=1